MRRLPVYMLLDTSTSMSGKPLNEVGAGLDLMVSTLRQDPYALETAFLSIITFDDVAAQVVPLTELMDFQAPELKARGLTALGRALEKVTDCVGNEVEKTTATTKGDWKPLVFLMTDGSPTDDWEKALPAFEANRPGLVVGCGAGSGANLDVLKRFCDVVVELDNMDKATMSEFFKWVSASVTTSSKRIDLSKEEPGAQDLPPPPAGITLHKN